jgi:parvulin-like peptidyl-prolyl isomerase
VINSKNDTSAIDRKLYLLKTGDIRSIGNSTYKIISDTVEYSFRASYIYLDGSTLSKNDIDSLRNLILKRYSAGTTFETLADEFTMDGNKKHGDLGFFSSGTMVKEFEQAMRSHADGEVFTVDVPDHQWFYIAKKTAANQVTQEITVLEVTGR